MVKKKRQNDHHEDDSTTESCDEKPLNNSQGSGSSSDCPHAKKAVDPTKLRKILKANGLETENCAECAKCEPISTESNKLDDVFEYDKTLWLCLKCGSQLCGRSKNKHALNHFMTPRSDSHALALNTTTLEIWCYECDDEVKPSLRKNLLECVEIAKKMSQKTPIASPDAVDKFNNIENKILATLDTMQPLLSEPLLNSQQTTKIASGPLVPGNARRVQTVDSLPRVRGLSNLGNTCFFNAVLQCLAQTPYLLEVLKEAATPGEEFVLPGGTFTFKDGTETDLSPIKGSLSSWGGLTSALAEALEALQSGGGVFTPQKLFHKLTTKCRQFEGGDQHDSHELLRHLLESVRSEDLQRYQKVILNSLDYKGQDLNLVGEDMKQKCKIYGQQAADRILRPEQVFRGFLVSTLTCQDCFHTSSCHESFLDISLPISVEKPQPPMRRKSSPEASPTGPSKHQLKKEKEKERKAKRVAKHHNKRIATQTLIGPTLPSGPTEDNIVTDVPTIKDIENNSNSRSSSSSSSEQSDADVEDNLIDDAPKFADGIQFLNRSIPPLYDPNGNNELPSPIGPEKRGDSPENPNKDSNSDENDSGIATSPANTAPVEQDSRGGFSPPEGEYGANSNNLVLELGISEQGATLVRQRTLSSGNEGVSGINLCNRPPTRELEKLNLKENEHIATKRKAKTKRVRTQSHSDWSTTIAPRYQCEDGECSIQSCLNNFTAVELMTGNNKVGCESCTKRFNGEKGKTIYTNATKQFLISSPPAVLILHLKRFQMDPRCMFRKMARLVSFPMVLDIAPFCGSKVKNLPNVDRKQKKLLYALYGIVEHSGSMHGGHYTAYVKVRAKLPPNDHRWDFLPQGSKAELDQTDEQRAKLDELLAKEKARELRLKDNDSDDFSTSSSSSGTEVDEDAEGAVGGSKESAEPNVTAPPGKWYFVSDSRVSESSEEAVLRAQAYLLFYERIY